MTKIINLFGGPGSGKSTTATGAFSKLKQMNYKIEYVSEYAKDIVWEETESLLHNQLHIFAEQFRRQWRLLEKVDYVITDSPILLSCVYFKHWYHQKNKEPFLPKLPFPIKYVDLSLTYFAETFNQFKNINFFINRNKEYVPLGRTQTEDEAKNIDLDIINMLKSYGQNYIETNSIDSIDDVVNYVKNNN